MAQLNPDLRHTACGILGLGNLIGESGNKQLDAAERDTVAACLGILDRLWPVADPGSNRHLEIVARAGNA